MKSSLELVTGFDPNLPPEKEMKYYTIILDGVDKCGKDTIRKILFKIDRGRYLCEARGYLSCMVYGEETNRPYRYDISSQKYVMNILLDVSKEDQQNRLLQASESNDKYDIESKLFDKYYNILKSKGYMTLRYNTSKMSAEDIAKDINERMNKLNNL